MSEGPCTAIPTRNVGTTHLQCVVRWTGHGALLVFHSLGHANAADPNRQLSPVVPTQTVPHTGQQGLTTSNSGGRNRPITKPPNRDIPQHVTIYAMSTTHPIL